MRRLQYFERLNMASRVNCCDPDRLQQLAEGSLSETELASLEVHLHGCSQCQTDLDRLTDENPWLGAARRYLGEETVVRPETATPTDAELDFLAPSDWPDSLGRLGPYEVKGLLGRGGMAVVLKAVDPALNRTVAIKVLALHLASCRHGSDSASLREAPVPQPQLFTSMSSPSTPLPRRVNCPT